jgi:hypothetical protein
VAKPHAIRDPAAGPLIGVSAYTMKHPPVQYTDYVTGCAFLATRECLEKVGLLDPSYYIYAEDAAPVFPKGTIIHVTAWYDNTKANKSNPDPDQWVGYGDRTVDEMAHAWMNVVYLSDAEYQERVAKFGEGVTNGVKPQRQTQQQQQ